MKGVLVFVLVAIVAAQGVPGDSSARPRLPDGAVEAYEERLAEQPDDPAANYNLGTALLLEGDHERARSPLERAAAAGSPVEGPASYNLGNTDLEPAFADSALSDRDDRLRRAIDAYKRALLADPGDSDAKWNLELARRFLESESPPPSGGGGGGGGQGPASGQPREQPSPSGQSGATPGGPQSAAETLLGAAQQLESEVQRDRLLKPLPPEGVRP